MLTKITNKNYKEYHENLQKMLINNLLDYTLFLLKLQTY